jgi:hypothetical protein
MIALPFLDVLEGLAIDFLRGASCELGALLVHRLEHKIAPLWAPKPSTPETQALAERLRIHLTTIDNRELSQLVDIISDECAKRGVLTCKRCFKAWGDCRCQSQTTPRVATPFRECGKPIGEGFEYRTCKLELHHPGPCP